MTNVLRSLAAYLDRGSYELQRLRAIAVYLRTGVRFEVVGRNSKIFGSSQMKIGTGIRLGDYCWIQAVTRYDGARYSPRLVIGDRVALSDLTHITCVKHIEIGRDCLLGSKIYIGDHHHGSLSELEQIRHVPPARRPLGDVEEILIGEMTWIGDGAVILPGTKIARCSVVGANSVVRLKEDRPALIAGVPARVIRYLDEAVGNGSR